MKWPLNFIKKKDFYNHIEKTIQNYLKVLKPLDLKNFNKNIIDPIKLTFDFYIFKTSPHELIKREILRQRNRSFNNLIGYFHQNIFNYIPGCIIPEKTWDIIYKNNSQIFFVEMKNKHNTMNSDSKTTVYNKMKAKTQEDKNAICFLVEVISRKSQNKTWKITLQNQPMKHERIRLISIDKFYELITGDSYAFKKICDILPKTIKEILNTKNYLNIENDTVIKELKPNYDIIKHLYLLAFSDYNGFSNK